MNPVIRHESSIDIADIHIKAIGFAAAGIFVIGSVFKGRMKRLGKRP